MALLISCWFIIETIIIPDGFLKWFYLSFYIHPFFLFLCQIFLWLKLLASWFLAILFFPARYFCFQGLVGFRYLRNFFTTFFSSTGRSNAKAAEEVENVYKHKHYIGDSYRSLSVAPAQGEIKVFKLRTYGFELENDYKEISCSLLTDGDTSVNESPPSVSSSSSISYTNDMDLTEYPSSVCSSNSPANDLDTNEYIPSAWSSNFVIAGRDHGTDEDNAKNSDSFYKNYTQRMRWFDILNYDRTCGISSILNKNLGAPGSFESIEPAFGFSVPYISWSKMAKKRLLRSLESDFEMVYVAQSCLSWESLHHQYRKVEALACSSSQNGVFYNNVAGEFQKFQVLLERFMEDERCKGKRFCNYVQGRFSLKSLLQVPEVSGFFEEEKEGMKGEAMDVKEVLKAIEKCIETFFVFVKTDNKKLWWKFTSSLWTYPPVEDPRDLKLLADLTKRLQKKELWLKDLQGKKKCWLKRVPNHFGESQRKEILFTMIDMKLVSRVLKMSMVSSSQLKWCQEKLDNVEFSNGKIIRTCIGPLFPTS